MGFQQGDRCFQTVEEAASYAGAQSMGQWVGNAGLTFDGYTGAALRYTLTGAAGTTTVDVPYRPQQCRLVETGDALTLTWAVVAVWAAAYAIRVAASAFR